MTFPIDHVGVVVRDIDAALPFYLELLGFAIVGREKLPAIHVELAYLTTEGKGTMIQLVRPSPPSPLWEHLQLHGEGLHHVCFAVPELGDAVRRLAPGATVSVNRGGRGRRACFLPETHGGGLRIELTEPEPSFGEAP